MSLAPPFRIWVLSLVDAVAIYAATAWLPPGVVALGGFLVGIVSGVILESVSAKLRRRHDHDHTPL